MDHNDLNERVYPYVYDRNARFSRVEHNLRLPKTNLQFEIKLMGLLHTNDVQYARKAIFCTNNPHNFTIQMLPKAVQIYEICAFKQKHSSISTHIYSISFRRPQFLRRCKWHLEGPNFWGVVNDSNFWGVVNVILEHISTTRIYRSKSYLLICCTRMMFNSLGK